MKTFRQLHEEIEKADREYERMTRNLNHALATGVPVAKLKKVRLKIAMLRHEISEIRHEYQKMCEEYCQMVHRN